MKKLILIAIVIGMSGCATQHVMRECKQLNPQDQELKDFWTCKHQWKIWQ